MTAWITLALALAAPPADAWTGFRHDGSSRSDARSLPLTWSPTENFAWRVPLPGYGQSSPVVWNGRAYLTAIEGPEKETLHGVAAVEGLFLVRTGTELFAIRAAR